MVGKTEAGKTRSGGQFGQLSKSQCCRFVIKVPIKHINVRTFPLLISSVHLLVVIGIFTSDIYMSHISGAGFRIYSQYSFIGGYHLLSVFLLASYAFGRRFRVSVLVLALYLGLHIYSLSVRLQGCYLCENPGPPVDLWTKAADRIVGLDLYVFVILFTLILWQVIYFSRNHSNKENLP